MALIPGREPTTADYKFKQGDRWASPAITFRETGVDFTAPGLRIRWKLKPDRNSAQVIYKDSGAAEITLDTSIAEEVTFGMILSAGETSVLLPRAYVYDIEITKPDGDVFTFIEGVITVTSQVTD